MRIEDCIVTVERRTGGGCLDLAIVFAREFIGPILGLMLTFAVPSCALTWLIASRTTDMLAPSLIIFAVFSSLFSGALIASIGPQVFGVPISVGAGLRGLRQRFVAFCFATFAVRMVQGLSMMCFILPAVIPTAAMGHLHEVLLLENAGFNAALSRLGHLRTGAGFGRNLYRVCGLLVFWGICSLGLFVMIDTLARWLFNTPIFLGTLIPGPDWVDALSAAVIDDPAVILLIQISLWIPYPVVRLAWFFCYLDQRIRNECWDVDLQFRAESMRLRELPS